MRHTDAEINRFASATARKMSDGCSKTYHEIKESLTQQLKEARDAYPDDEDPPDMSPFLLPPHPAGDTPEVIFVRRFFAWSISILFILVTALVVWSSIVEVPQ